MTPAEKERAAIVAWLRQDARDFVERTMPGDFAGDCWARAQERLRVATRIEQGHHLNTGDSHE